MAQLHNKTWHQKHIAQLSLGQRIADFVAKSMGSWTFIISQTIFVCFWIAFNIIAWLNHFDPFPFILLNLLFSTQAAYAAPVIMMSQNRQSERDRYQANEDYETNIKAKEEIEELQKSIARIENEKLSEILILIKNLQKDIKK